MTIKSKEEAQKFIEQVAEENGLVTPDEREFLEKYKPGILKKLNNLRKQLGSATRTYVLFIIRH
jgi:hypothetical protein